jgi:hypothetical protein
MPCKKFDSSQFFQALRLQKKQTSFVPLSFLSSSFQNKSSSFSQKAASLSKTPLTLFFIPTKKIVLFEADLLAFGSWCPFHIIKDEKKKSHKTFFISFYFIFCYYMFFNTSIKNNIIISSSLFLFFIIFFIIHQKFNEDYYYLIIFLFTYLLFFLKKKTHLFLISAKKQKKFISCGHINPYTFNIPFFWQNIISLSQQRLWWWSLQNLQTCKYLQKACFTFSHLPFFVGLPLRRLKVS